MMYGVHQLNADRMDARATRLRSYLAVDPVNADLACELADALAAESDFRGAREVLEALPQASAQGAGVRFRRARMALALGDYAQAENQLLQLLEQGEDGVALRHDLAFARLCRRDAAGAQEAVSAAARRFGTSPQLSVLEARIALLREDFAAAIASADAALASDLDDAAAQGVRALALLDAGETDAARDAAAQCIERHPDQHEALLVAGTCALWSQDPAQAAYAFERALSRHPNSGRALSGYGQTQMMLGETQAARETLERAVRAMPDHIGTWHALAWTLLLEGSHEQADACYRKAYELDRNFGDTHGGLALTAALRGDFASAEQAAKRAIRLDPQAVTARYALVLTLEAKGEQAQADALMQELLRASGSAPPEQARQFADALKSKLRARAT